MFKRADEALDAGASDGQVKGADWNALVVAVESLQEQAPVPGPQGIKGDKGDQGEPGPAGPQGPQGEPGAVGQQGPQGPQGLKGDTGAAGAAGVMGPAGMQGPRGVPGVSPMEGLRFKLFEGVSPGAGGVVRFPLGEIAGSVVHVSGVIEYVTAGGSLGWVPNEMRREVGWGFTAQVSVGDACIFIHSDAGAGIVGKRCRILVGYLG